MSEGFYKRRRGIVEHIEAGTIDLLESGIHDYLSLRANLVIGSPSSIPVGVCFTSAPAIRPYCKRWVKSDRTMQRVLEHMEEIGWIKTWPTQSGNYPALLCRASVHDLSGNEYRINGAKTTDWRHPVYEAVGELSASCPQVVGKVATLREERSKEERVEEEQISAAAFDAIGFDKPFGHSKFKTVWLRRFKERKAGEWLTGLMEEVIQECQKKGIGVPPQFYGAKRDVDARETAEFSSKRVPL